MSDIKPTLREFHILLYFIQLRVCPRRALFGDKIIECLSQTAVTVYHQGAVYGQNNPGQNIQCLILP